MINLNTIPQTITAAVGAIVLSATFLSASFGPVRPRLAQRLAQRQALGSAEEDAAPSRDHDRIGGPLAPVAGRPAARSWFMPARYRRSGDDDSRSPDEAPCARISGDHEGAPRA